MQLKIDSDKFDEYQKALMRELIEQIRFKLAAGGVTGNNLHDLTLEVAFSVASTLDDTAKIEVEGTPVRPYITFREDEQLLHNDENSYMHEHVSSLIEKVFSNE
ncbi:MAG: hypothetical protein OQK94_00055 [Gammaproteobacteria bacterium]|nr:hypothetical protein [Gammaproteobacteria bacterium]MCW8841555.1 hypothetical protein [Gammaproteobacteria bacterium]MCW8958097.1 hypothetical protein [Gammaproteobacteria bacterium]MCW8973130.1 hypothetical protein [Gammaproteobacteria bacterium]MCW8993083.1 hypothetical protein [Gammaproteobacteria bacterium]